MAKIERKHQKIFGGNASNNGQFGSAQAGTKVTSTDLDTLQSLSAYESGWNDAVISSQNLPALEEMQALDYINTSQLAYIFQEGLVEYSAEATYYTNSVVKKTGTYELYGSLIDDNLGNALPSQADDSNWQYLGDLSNLVNTENQILHIREEQTSGNGEVANISGTNVRTLNTVVNNSIPGASLSSNQITLPAGTYKIEGAAPAFRVNRHKVLFYNVTDGLTSIVGTSEFSNSSTINAVVKSIVREDITLASSKVFELRHYTETVNSTNGLGVATASGQTEIYSDVYITKIG